MQADTVIATHTNTDFDAFASLLAARRLYPDAVVALPGALNRNVRDFYRLHADELEVVESAHLHTAVSPRLAVGQTLRTAPLASSHTPTLDPAFPNVGFA